MLVSLVSSCNCYAIKAIKILVLEEMRITAMQTRSQAYRVWVVDLQECFLVVEEL